MHIAYTCLSANRGIGLEIVTQLVASSNNLVIAACRTPEKATALKDLKKSARGVIHIIKIDVSNFDSIRASTKALQAVCGKTGLNYLINNTGIVRILLRSPQHRVTFTHSHSGTPSYRSLKTPCPLSIRSACSSSSR